MIFFSMDFITDLPLSDGFDALYVCVDRLTKMVRVAPCCKTHGAEDIAHIFINNVFRRHGLPVDIVSDRDGRFTSKFWATLCSKLGINRSMSSAFHPQSDGNTERVNRVLEDMLRHYVNAAQTDWVSWLPIVEFAINNAPHDSTGSSPFEKKNLPPVAVA